MIDTITATFGGFSDGFVKGWAQEGGKIVPGGGKFLASFGAIGAVGGVGAEAYQQGDWYAPFSTEGATAAAVGAGAAIGAGFLWKNRKALKTSLFSGASEASNRGKAAWSRRASKAAVAPSMLDPLGTPLVGPVEFT